MVTRNINISINEFYHIYNRGTDKREIFLDDNDRERFVKLLFIANSTKPFVLRDLPIGLPYVEFDRGETLVDIGAYVLMPNHFHLLIKERIDNGISIFMNKLSTSYSMYFNKKYSRTGRLFEGTFKAKHIQEDEYLKYLFAYIHLNPVKLIDPKWKENGIQNKKEAEIYLFKYKYSSYIDYINIARIENQILNKNSFPEYFLDQDFSTFIKDFLNYKPLERENT